MPFVYSVCLLWSWIVVRRSIRIINITFDVHSYLHIYNAIFFTRYEHPLLSLRSLTVNHTDKYDSPRRLEYYNHSYWNYYKWLTCNDKPYRHGRLTDHDKLFVYYKPSRVTPCLLSTSHQQHVEILTKTNLIPYVFFFIQTRV